VVLEHSNPLMVPVANRDFAWDQIVDVMDDYFRIQREQRVRLVGDVLTEGRIDTWPVTGATLLEPQLKDSPGLYNRVESTLQTIRRHALVRVIPAAEGYLVEVVVRKELEDLSRPERTTASAASFHENLTPDGDDLNVPFDSAEKGWISQGRDLILEQRILSQIQARLGCLAPPPLY
jgi:hypothetical protein